MTLSVPHFQQATSYTCLPACVRMVLSFLGYGHTESELATAFGTVPLLGTPPENVVSALEEMGYHALWFENQITDRISAHDLRHTWATQTAREPGMTLLRLQETGGWSSLAMPRRYIEDAKIANEGMVT